MQNDFFTFTKICFEKIDVASILKSFFEIEKQDRVIVNDHGSLTLVVRGGTRSADHFEYYTGKFYINANKQEYLPKAFIS